MPALPLDKLGNRAAEGWPAFERFNLLHIAVGGDLYIDDDIFTGGSDIFSLNTSLAV